MNAANVVGNVTILVALTLIFLVVIVFICAGVIIGMYGWSANTASQIESWKMLGEYSD